MYRLSPMKLVLNINHTQGTFLKEIVCTRRTTPRPLMKDSSTRPAVLRFALLITEMRSVTGPVRKHEGASNQNREAVQGFRRFM